MERDQQIKKTRSNELYSGKFNVTSIELIFLYKNNLI